MKKTLPQLLVLILLLLAVCAAAPAQNNQTLALNGVVSKGFKVAPQSIDTRFSGGLA